MDRFKNLLSLVKDLILRGFAMFQDNNMSVYSGYATLFIVTAVFPCIILIISIVNLIPGYSAKDVADILFQILPDLGSIEDFAVSLLLDIKDQSGGLLASAAAVTTLWSASKGVMAIQKGLNQLDSEDVVSEAKDEAEVETKEDKKRGLLEKGIAIAKPILKRLAFTLMLIILIPALLIFEMLGDSLANTICSAVKKANPDVLNSTLENIDSFFHISSLVVILLALLVIMIIFAKLPAKGRTLKSQLPGALATGICWFLFTELFAFFIPRFYHASNLYGSLASLFLVLLWLRFIVMILFAGGVLNRTLEERRQEGIL
ncbi:MAG: YihY/virulence factor BrkB family protein [Firmicutes bacterium]|nr:YihY/virulence factor BrkB family protein [Bacillota bacterium]